MKHRVILVTILSTVIVFNTGCMTFKVSSENIETVLSWKSKKIRSAEILEVEKKSGEKIEFSREEPGRIAADSINGPAGSGEGEVSVPLEEVASVWLQVKRFSLGRTLYRVLIGIGIAFLAQLLVYRFTEM